MFYQDSLEDAEMTDYNSTDQDGSVSDAIGKVRTIS